MLAHGGEVGIKTIPVWCTLPFYGRVFGVTVRGPSKAGGRAAWLGCGAKASVRPDEAA